MAKKKTTTDTTAAPAEGADATTTAAPTAAPAEPAATAAPAESTPIPTAVPTADVHVSGTKVQSQWLLPTETTIVGWPGDTEPPPADAPHILHKLYVPQRLAELQTRDGQAALEALEAQIEAAGGVTNPITAVAIKVAGEKKVYVVEGRRRTIALRNVNARRVAAGRDPLAYRVVFENEKDPSIWFKIRTANAGQKPDSAAQIAEDVAKMKLGDAVLGIPPMDYDAIGAVYGKNHQFARAMHDIAKSAPKLIEAVREGKIDATAASIIAGIKGDHPKQVEQLNKWLAAGPDKQTQEYAKILKQEAGHTRTGQQGEAGGGTRTEPRYTERKTRAAMRGLVDDIHRVDKGEVDQIFPLPDGERWDEAGTARIRRDLLVALATLRASMGEEDIQDASIDPDQDSWRIWNEVNTQAVRGESLLKSDEDKVNAEESEKRKAEANAKKAEEERVKAEAKAAREAEAAAKKAKAEAEKAAAAQKKLDEAKNKLEAQKAALEKKAAELKAKLPTPQPGLPGTQTTPATV